MRNLNDESVIKIAIESICSLICQLLTSAVNIQHIECQILDLYTSFLSFSVLQCTGKYIVLVYSQMRNYCYLSCNSWSKKEEKKEVNKPISQTAGCFAVIYFWLLPPTHLCAHQMKKRQISEHINRNDNSPCCHLLPVCFLPTGEEGKFA